MNSTCMRSDWVVLPVGGEITRDTVSGLYLQIQRSLKKGRVNILLDLDRATFVDSSALGILVRAYKDTRIHGGELALTRVPACIQGVLEYTRLDCIFRQTIPSTSPEDPEPLEAA